MRPHNHLLRAIEKPRIGFRRAAGALCLFSVLFFARSLSNYFVCDDFQFLGRVNLFNAGMYFTKSWGYGNEYRPLVPYSYALDAYISGENPFGYHLTNTLLHTANGVLTSALALEIGISPWAASLAGLIYILNPVSHEAVLWISGRPVVLSTFLILSCIWLFLRAAQTGQTKPWLWAVPYGLFLLALGTYELAIVTPLLIAFMCYLKQGMNRDFRGHLIVLLLIALIYALFWNWFFDFRFTRVKIEHSMLTIFANFGQALTHALHGSLRIAVLPFYLGLLGWFGRTHRGRTILLGTLVWFMISYLPYFAVKGYADRFAYLASASIAVLLAIAIREIANNSRRMQTAILVFVCYLGIGMQNRITAWKEAGQIAKYIPGEVKRQLPVFPSDRQVILLSIPAMHKRSYVFLTGLDRAFEHEYPGANIQLATAVDSSTSDSALIFEYAHGRIVRRTRSEVLSR
jgi:hypothetical protein